MPWSVSNEVATGGISRLSIFVFAGRSVPRAGGRGKMVLSRQVGTHHPDEVLERILDRGMVLDGLSHLVVLAGSFKVSTPPSDTPAIPQPVSVRRRELGPASAPPRPDPPVIRATVVQRPTSTPAMRATRIVHGEFYADVLPDRQHPGKLWLYVVQRQGCRDVLAMGSSASQSDAQTGALETIRDLRRAAASIRAG